MLRAMTVVEFRALWSELDLTRLDASFAAWEAAALDLIRRQRVVSSSLALDYLRAMQADAGVVGALVAADGPSAEAVAVSLRSTAVVPVKRSMMAGRALAEAGQAARTLAEGAVSRHVLDAGRETVTGSLARDGRGWRRVTRGALSCSFCRMLAGRGAVYKAGTSRFQSHDHCGCQAEPVYL